MALATSGRSNLRENQSLLPMMMMMMISPVPFKCHVPVRWLINMCCFCLIEKSS